MSQGLEVPLQGNDDDHASSKSTTQRLKNKTESESSYVSMDSQNQKTNKSKHQRNRSLSIGSMADGNRRKNYFNGIHSFNSKQ